MTQLSAQALNLLCRGEVTSPAQLKQIYSVKDGSGNTLDDEGYKVKNTFGSYIHIHFGSSPAIAGNLVNYSKEHYGTDTFSRTR